MTTIRRFCCNDLLRFSDLNLDHLTLRGKASDYMKCIICWPGCVIVAVAPRNRIMGYVLGAVEEQGKNWLGHIACLTVRSEYRRWKLGSKLIRLFEIELLDKLLFSPHEYSCSMRIYIDVGNAQAISFIKKIGFQFFRRLPDYYDRKGDALDMRKKLLLEDDKEFRSFLN